MLICSFKHLINWIQTELNQNRFAKMKWPGQDSTTRPLSLFPFWLINSDWFSKSSFLLKWSEYYLSYMNTYFNLHATRWSIYKKLCSNYSTKISLKSSIICIIKGKKKINRIYCDSRSIVISFLSARKQATPRFNIQPKCIWRCNSTRSLVQNKV